MRAQVDAAHRAAHAAAQEREAYQRQLASTQAHLAAVSDSAMDAIITFDGDQHIMQFNRAAEQIFGCSAAEAIGQPVERFVPGVVQEAQRRSQVSDRLKGRRCDGEEFPIKAGFARTERDHGSFYTTIVRDMSAARRLEAQYLQAQKMEGIGRLAGGLAHDFNNLLTAIIGYTELVLSQVKPDDPIYYDLSEVQRVAERASGLTRQLLAFARKQIIEPQVLNLGALLLKLDGMVRRLIGEDIELVTTIDPTLWRVQADPGQVEQLLLNLIVNARDAMPEGGRLTIECRNTWVDADFTDRQFALQPGPYLLLSVSDTGTGIPEEVRPYLFEPFFTTKSVDKGTGLGLATCYGIVKQHGGHITFYSELGCGTTFKVYLPRSEDSSRLDADFERPEARNGTEHILLVEDDNAVRQMTARVLEARGYTVTQAGSVADAIEKAQVAPEFDLLITDIVMPQMNGRELAQRVRDVCPEIRVLYISGYAEQAAIHSGWLGADEAFLQKPFSPVALAYKVREALDDTSAWADSRSGVHAYQPTAGLTASVR